MLISDWGVLFVHSTYPSGADDDSELPFDSVYDVKKLYSYYSKRRLNLANRVGFCALRGLRVVTAWKMDDYFPSKQGKSPPPPSLSLVSSGSFSRRSTNVGGISFRGATWEGAAGRDFWDGPRVCEAWAGAHRSYLQALWKRVQVESSHLEQVNSSLPLGTNCPWLHFLLRPSPRDRISSGTRPVRRWGHCKTRCRNLTTLSPSTPSLRS